MYANSLQEIPDFIFDEAVVEVFADMINRSVPGYASVVAVCGALAERYSQPNTAIYDLGCSLGAATLSMRGGIESENCEIIAVDNAPAMIAKPSVMPLVLFALLRANFSASAIISFGEKCMLSQLFPFP